MKIYKTITFTDYVNNKVRAIIDENYECWFCFKDILCMLKSDKPKLVDDLSKDKLKRFTIKYIIEEIDTDEITQEEIVTKILKKEKLLFIKELDLFNFLLRINSGYPITSEHKNVNHFIVDYVLPDLKKDIRNMKEGRKANESRNRNFPKQNIR